MLAKKRKGATEKRKGSSGIASLLWMFIGSILTLMIGLFLYLWNPFNMEDTQTVTEPRTVEPRTTTNTEAEREEYEFYDLLPQQEVTSIPDESVAQGNTLSDTDRALQQILLDSDVDVVVSAPDEPTPANTDNRADEGGTVVAATGDEEVVIIEEQGTYEGVPTQEAQNSGANAVAPANNAQSNPSNQTATPPPQQTAQEAAPRTTYILQINSFSNAEEADVRRAQVLMAGVDAQVVKKEMENGQIFYQVVTPPIQNRQAIMTEQQRLQNNGIDSLIVEQRR